MNRRKTVLGIDAVLRTMAEYRPDAMLIVPDSLFFDQRDRV